ncbi:hypothetical protein ACOME3_000043 [Neoechinorhynchus agilis]
MIESRQEDTMIELWPLVEQSFDTGIFSTSDNWRSVLKIVTLASFKFDIEGKLRDVELNIALTLLKRYRKIMLVIKNDIDFLYSIRNARSVFKALLDTLSFYSTEYFLENGRPHHWAFPFWAHWEKMVIVNRGARICRGLINEYCQKADILNLEAINDVCKEIEGLLGEFHNDPRTGFRWAARRMSEIFFKEMLSRFGHDGQVGSKVIDFFVEMNYRLTRTNRINLQPVFSQQSFRSWVLQECS